MKTLVLLAGVVVAVFATLAVSAQNEGRIIYQVKVNMHRTLPPDRQQMKEMIPEFDIHRDQLVFNKTESYYSPVEEEPLDEDMSDGMVRMRFRRPQIELYSNSATFEKTTMRELFGKNYVIKDTIIIQPWKLSEENKTIQGYPCKSATFTDTQRNLVVVAWYTDKIKPFLGPENFGTLPGTVLEVDINKGERVITAEKIEFVPLKKGEIKIPSNGIKVTEAEFQKILAEVQKKMGAQGGVMIRTN